MATKAKTSSTSRKAPLPRPSRKIEDKAQYSRFRDFADAHWGPGVLRLRPRLRRAHGYRAAGLPREFS